MFEGILGGQSQTTPGQVNPFDTGSQNVQPGQETVTPSTQQTGLEVGQTQYNAGTGQQGMQNGKPQTGQQFTASSEQLILGKFSSLDQIKDTLRANAAKVGTEVDEEKLNALTPEDLIQAYLEDERTLGQPDSNQLQGESHLQQENARLRDEMQAMLRYLQQQQMMQTGYQQPMLPQPSMPQMGMPQAQPQFGGYPQTGYQYPTMQDQNPQMYMQPQTNPGFQQPGMAQNWQDPDTFFEQFSQNGPQVIQSMVQSGVQQALQGAVIPYIQQMQREQQIQAQNQQKLAQLQNQVEFVRKNNPDFEMHRAQMAQIITQRPWLLETENGVQQAYLEAKDRYNQYMRQQAFLSQRQGMQAQRMVSTIPRSQGHYPVAPNTQNLAEAVFGVKTGGGLFNY